jgi:DNA-binding LytR/AlgR family response regulator
VRLVVADAEILSTIDEAIALLPFAVQVATARGNDASRQTVVIIDAADVGEYSLPEGAACLVTSRAAAIPIAVLQLKQMLFLRKPCSSRVVADALISLIARLRHEQPDRLIVRSGSSIYFFAASEIDWLKAEGNYLRIHAYGKARLVRETLTSFLARNPRFIRVQRSVAANVDRIEEIRNHRRNGYVLLRDGTRLPFSSAFRSELDVLMHAMSA